MCIVRTVVTAITRHSPNISERIGKSQKYFRERRSEPLPKDCARGPRRQGQGVYQANLFVFWLRQIYEFGDG